LVKNTWEYANFDVDEDERIYVDLNNVLDDESDEKNVPIDKKQLMITEIQNLLKEIKTGSKQTKYEP
jgi:hypothetical protein